MMVSLTHEGWFVLMVTTHLHGGLQNGSPDESDRGATQTAVLRCCTGGESTRSILLLRVEIYQQKILSILLKFDMTEDLFYEHRGWVYLKFCNLLFLNNKR